MKSSDTRLIETVTFIRNLATLDAGQRTRAADQAESYIDSLGGMAATLSTSLHIGDSGPDHNNNRAYRRAYVLLHKAVAHDHGVALTGLPPGAITIAGPTAALNLPAVVRFAAILRCQKTFANYMMLQAMQALLNNPLQFLQQNKLMVSGSPRREVGQGDRNTMAFYLTYSLDNERYDLTPDPLPGCAPVMADSVVARWWTDIPGSHVAGNQAAGNFSQLEGIELASPLMVTTQFTGCAFAMKHINGHTYCAHTTPKAAPGYGVAVRPMTGNQLAQDIHSVNGVAGDFQNAPGAPALAIYGAGWSVGTIGNVHYPNGLGGGNYMTIVGTPAGGGLYHIYSQITQNRAITSAQRIF